ncbi:MAG: hypothetical protein H6636_02995 [Anaerolineales bacterium]|nr:hypothetical protein [Anaerolineales bacterium]
MLTQSSPTHLTVEKTEHDIRLTLPSKKSIGQILWFTFWLLGWGLLTANVYYLVRQLFTMASLSQESGGSFPLFLIPLICVGFFILILLVLGAFGIYVYVWQLAGKEIVEINSQTMSISRQILRWKKSNNYSSNLVRNVRINVQSVSFAPLQTFRKLSGRTGMIIFDYEKKIFHFGLDIDETEAKQIITALTQYLPNV